MKYLVLLLFLLSCSKVTYSPSKENNVSIMNQEELLGFEINPQIDMMIFFVWPKDLNFHDEDTVQKIIETSKRILERKELYLEIQKELSHAFSANECDCHLYYECFNELEPNDEIANKCQEIEDDKSLNQEKVIEFYQDYESIKEMLSKIGAELIDIGMDDDYIDIGVLDFNSSEIQLKKMNAQSFNLKSLSIPFRLKKDDISYLELDFKLPNNLRLNGKIDISPRLHSVIFQGEFELSDGRTGLLYWEHLK